MDNGNVLMENNIMSSNLNPLSARYNRYYNNNDKNIFKNAGEDLIINSNKALTNKHSQKSLFSPRNINNKKIKKIFNPYLITACKHAIIKERRELPNYKEIIRNINTEFGIKETEKQNYEPYTKSRIRLSINIDSNNTK